MVDKIEHNLIDMIILDITPDSNQGWTILQRIKAIYRIPTVLMSEDNNLRTTKEFIELGCDDYITKGFGPLMIKEIIHNITKRRK